MSIHKFKGGAGDKIINGNIVGAVRTRRYSSKYTVLSGFSDSDYFSSPVNFPSKPTGFSIILRVSFSQSTTSWQYFFGSKDAKLPLLGFANGKLGVHLGTNGSSWTVWGPSYGVTTLGLNRYYYIKMKQDENGAFMLQTSLDGETWTTEISTASGQSPVVGDCPFYIGAGWTSGAATYANIDFQSSYIKIYNNSVWTTLWEGTRWAHIDRVLHGTGYTYNVDVQGSPTISNGTVSGFTTSNYVQLPTPFNPGTGADWELMLHFKTGAVNTGTGQEVFNRCVNTHYGFRIGINSSVASFWYTIDAGTSSHNFEQAGTYTIAANTEYWIRFKFNGSKYTSEISTDGSTWTQDISYAATFKITTTTNANTLGVNNSKIRPFQGEIYLKDCYINLSGYRWWTGAYNVKNIESVYHGVQRVFGKDHLTKTFTATGSLQTYVVPDFTNALQITAIGGKGYNGAAGGKVTTTLSVTLGETLYVWAGLYGSNFYDAIYNASDIRTSNADITSTDGLNSRLVVAGAGGSYSYGYSPGVGGGLTGGTGNYDILWNAGGGTQTAGGSRSTNRRATVTDGPWYGSDGAFGLGGQGVSQGGGAGGAGWYGGGAGCCLGAKKAGYQASGGGGGSSYTHPDRCTNVLHTQGASESTGAGYVVITPIV